MTRGRNSNDASTSHVFPATARREECTTDCPSGAPEETKLADILTSDFQTPKLWENKCLLFEAPQVCGYFLRQPRKLIPLPRQRFPPPP